jgi:hypothetical protein
MEFIEATSIYQELCVGLEYSENMGKTRIQVIEEYATKHGTEKVKEAIEVLRARQDKEHQTHLDVLRMVQIVNGQKMSGVLLNLLIVTINCTMRHCKERLEIEKKAKEVAFLQGKLAGCKELLNHLCGQFGLRQEIVEDTGESMPEIQNYSTPHIMKLWRDLQAVRNDARWDSVLERVNTETENIKNSLLQVANNSRDLYILQSKHQGMTVFINLFKAIEAEEEDRKNELDFDGGDEDEGASGLSEYKEEDDQNE